MPGLLQLRGRPIGGLFESTPSLRGLGRGSWEQQASRAMQREGTGGSQVTMGLNEVMGYSPLENSNCFF